MPPQVQQKEQKQHKQLQPVIQAVIIFKKDLTEYDTAHGGPHGVAYTRQEQRWAKSTQSAFDKEHQNSHEKVHLI